MNADLLLDAVRAEVAYRTEELQKSGRGFRLGAARRAAKANRAARKSSKSVEIPAQERRVLGQAVSAREITR